MEQLPSQVDHYYVRVSWKISQWCILRNFFPAVSNDECYTSVLGKLERPYIHIFHFNNPGTYIYNLTWINFIWFARKAGTTEYFRLVFVCFVWGSSLRRRHPSRLPVCFRFSSAGLCPWAPGDLHAKPVFYWQEIFVRKNIHSLSLQINILQGRCSLVYFYSLRFWELFTLH